MSIFNSLGSNYSTKQVWRSLLPASPNAPAALADDLKRLYSAPSVYLTYKGREAITLVLRQLNLSAGSYVAINGYTCYVVYAAVQAAGFKPYMLDIDENNLNFSAETLKRGLQAQPHIKAVIIQNTLGMACDMAAIKELCDQHNMPLIEDLAHSAGLKYATGQQAGTVGSAAALSFSQDKIIDAVSGGAAVLHQAVSPEPALASVSLKLRVQAFFYPLNSLLIRKTHTIGFGKIWLKLLKILKLLPNQMAGDPKVVRKLPAHQARATQLALSDLPAVLMHRQKIAAIYHAAIAEGVQLPFDSDAVYIRFPLKVGDPRSLESHLRTAGIHIARPWYDAVIAPGRYMPLTDYQAGTCPHAEDMAAHIINLPTHINVTQTDAQFIAGKVNEWLKLQ